MSSSSPSNDGPPRRRRAMHRLAHPNGGIRQKRREAGVAVVGEGRTASSTTSIPRIPTGRSVGPRRRRHRLPSMPHLRPAGPVADPDSPPGAGCRPLPLPRRGTAPDKAGHRMLPRMPRPQTLARNSPLLSSAPRAKSAFPRTTGLMAATSTDRAARRAGRRGDAAHRRALADLGGDQSSRVARPDHLDGTAELLKARAHPLLGLRRLGIAGFDGIEQNSTSSAVHRGMCAAMSIDGGVVLHVGSPVSGEGRAEAREVPSNRSCGPAVNVQPVTRSRSK